MFNPKQQQMILIYQDQVRRNRVNKSEIARQVGLHGHAYVARTIQQWRAEQNAPKGQLRECLCCDDHFVSSGKHHRLCDKCRFNGEYSRTYSLSPAICHLGRAF